MKGYFVRKPETVEELKAAAEYGEKHRSVKAQKINEIGQVLLSLDEYIRFCDNLLNYYDFYKPYAEKSLYHDGAADCVIVAAPGQRKIAVCLEGYEYTRYAAWVMKG